MTEDIEEEVVVARKRENGEGNGEGVLQLYALANCYGRCGSENKQRGGVGGVSFQATLAPPRPSGFDIRPSYSTATVNSTELKTMVPDEQSRVAGRRCGECAAFRVAQQ